MAKEAAVNTLPSNLVTSVVSLSLLDPSLASTRPT